MATAISKPTTCATRQRDLGPDSRVDIPVFAVIFATVIPALGHDT